MRGTLIRSSRAVSCGLSPAWPAVRTRLSGSPLPSTIRCSLVDRPPRDRPSASPAGIPDRFLSFERAPCARARGAGAGGVAGGGGAGGVLVPPAQGGVDAGQPVELSRRIAGRLHRRHQSRPGAVLGPAVVALPRGLPRAEF